MTTDITELAQSLKAAAEKASNGDWVKESGDGWEACCSANDQANGGYIIAHFVGPDAAENREFVQAANPANILALVEVVEKAQAQSSKWLEAYHKAVSIGARYEERIAELESNKPDIYLCRVIRNGEELYSQCGADYPRGTGYYRSAPVESRTVKLPSLNPEMFNGDVMFGYRKAQKEAVDFCAAAGIKLEVR